MPPSGESLCNAENVIYTILPNSAITTINAVARWRQSVVCLTFVSFFHDFFDDFLMQTTNLKLSLLSESGQNKLSSYLNLHSCSNKHFNATCQKSFDTGILPEDWKLANVSPLFKKGAKLDPGNYRPVSLTSVICKTSSSAIAERPRCRVG